MKESRYDENLCPIEATLRVIGKKWTLLILRELLNGRRRFSEISSSLPISTKLLWQRLRELEDFGIVTRTTYPEVPPRVEYTLTESGHSLECVLNVMRQWGSQHMPLCQQSLGQASANGVYAQMTKDMM